VDGLKGIVHPKMKISHHSLIFSYYGSQWGPETVWLPTFF